MFLKILYYQIPLVVHKNPKQTNLIKWNLLAQKQKTIEKTERELTQGPHQIQESKHHQGCLALPLFLSYLFATSFVETSLSFQLEFNKSLVKNFS